MTDTFDPTAAAHLLRQLAAEIRSAEGATRNGLFLELHRLHDTIFRLSLESHPDLPPDLQGTAFNLEEPMAAPQVVRELNRLSSPLASKEIRNLYKHMNMARNNMAHEAVIGRVTISNSNMKRMVELATLVATVLDPTPPLEPTSPIAHRSVFAFTKIRLYLMVGILIGISVGWGWIGNNNPFIALGITIIAVVLIVAMWATAD